MSEHAREPQAGPAPDLVNAYRDDRPGQSSSSAHYLPYQEGHPGSFGSHLEGSRPSPWDSQSSYAGSSSRQGPLLPLPNAPPLGHAFDAPAASSHQSFMFDMMHRSPANYLGPPQPASPQYGGPSHLPPPPPPLFPDVRRDQEPTRPTYDRRYPSTHTDPRGSASPPSSASDRSGQASGSFSVPGVGAGFGSVNAQQPEPYYSPSHLQGGFPTPSSSSSYFSNQYAPPPPPSNGNNTYPYHPYAPSHPLPPPSNMLNSPLPYPFHFSGHNQPSPQSSIATPALWSSSFPRDIAGRPFSAPTPPPHHQHLVYDSEHIGSSSSGLPSRARRSESNPSGWNAMGGDLHASSSSHHQSSSSSHTRPQPYARPSPRARSASAAERGGAKPNGGGRKKLPVEATDTLLNFYLQPQGKYPSREQKLEWERTTGLTLQQVEDWFINKRRRIKTSTLAAEDAAKRRS